MISSRWPPPSLCCAATLFPAHRPCRPRPLRRAGVRKPPPAQQAVCSYNVLTRASSSLFPAAARSGRSSRRKAGYPRRQTELPPRLALAAPPPYLPRRRPYSRPRPGPPHTGETPAAGAGGRGEVPERSNGAVSKTVVRLAYRGFESHPLRHRPIFLPPSCRPERPHGGRGAEISFRRGARSEALRWKDFSTPPRIGSGAPVEMTGKPAGERSLSSRRAAPASAGRRQSRSRPAEIDIQPASKPTPESRSTSRSVASWSRFRLVAPPLRPGIPAAVNSNTANTGIV